MAASSRTTPSMNFLVKRVFVVAERKNRTLMDMARSMLAEFKSPLSFWAEAISTTCHSSNRLYFSKGLNKTPYEILTGNKPNISYFRVFGCKCFYLIKGCRLTKFESKTLEGIFVGYGAESHTYRIYDKASWRIIESCSVVFEKNDGSQVAQFHVSDVDEIPQEAIRRMGVGFFRPIEETLVADREGQCYTQVEPSSTQENHANEEPIAPTQEQVEDLQPLDQVATQEPNSPFFDASLDQYLAQSSPSSFEDVHNDEQGQVSGQDRDTNYQDDQVIPPRCNEDIKACRQAGVAKTMERYQHTLDVVVLSNLVGTGVPSG